MYYSNMIGGFTIDKPLNFEQQKFVERMTIGAVTANKISFEWLGPQQNFGLEQEIKDLNSFLKRKGHNLKGVLIVFGEDPLDIWRLIIINGEVIRQEADLEKAFPSPLTGYVEEKIQND